MLSTTMNGNQKNVLNILVLNNQALHLDDSYLERPALETVEKVKLYAYSLERCVHARICAFVRAFVRLCVCAFALSVSLCVSVCLRVSPCLCLYIQAQERASQLKGLKSVLRNDR